MDLLAKVELQETVSMLLAGTHARVRDLTLANGQRFWLKRIEVLPLRMRLQKGDPRSAFEAEKLGLQVLSREGLPVADLALDGPDYLVLSDAGQPLNQVLHAADAEERRAAFSAAGQALAQLHAAGFVHGRPAIRDICWDGHAARFIDLERFSTARRGLRQQALDVVMFVQTMMTATAGPSPELDAALDAYARTAPPAVMPRVRKMAHHLAWLAPLARAVTWVRPQAREFVAIPRTLARLR